VSPLIRRILVDWGDEGFEYDELGISTRVGLLVQFFVIVACVEVFSIGACIVVIPCITYTAQEWEIVVF
jgi:hypothetical protein